MKLAPLAALVALVAGACLPPAAAAAEPLSVVAAENFYGDVVAQLGGPEVRVTSILSNPEQDPHLFESSASAARAVAAARLVVYNGLDYDPWMDKLLAAHRSPSRKVIVAASLLRRRPGDNPHLWYDPAAMPAVANAVAAALAESDPVHREDYERRRQTFIASLQPLTAKIDSIRQRYAGTVVTATEPVFGYMADALGFTMRNRPFQLAVMNDTEPGASQIAAFEKDLKSRTVKLLFYNRQTSGNLTTRLQKLAQESQVPIVGVSETAPPDTKFQDWILQALAATEQALAGSGR